MIRDLWDKSGCVIDIHAQPGAKVAEVSGLHGAALKIKVKSPPVDGRANGEIGDLLADRLGVPRKSVTLERGAKSRAKTFKFLGISATAAKRLLRIDSA